MKMLFKFKVMYWDSEDGEDKICSGIVGAEDLAAACQKALAYCSVDDDYSEVESIEVSPLQDPLEWAELREMPEVKES